MILHIFNPEHDLALANNNKNFIAPHAARLLRSDLDFLPALWAEKGELVFVKDLASATKHLQRFSRFTRQSHIISKELLQTIKSDITEVRPWGWDESVKQELIKLGVSNSFMPTEQELFLLRQMSNRQFAALILNDIRNEFPFQNIVGDTSFLTDYKELNVFIKSYKKAVLKAPWSSSGRGIRYIDNSPNQHTINWAHNVMKKQGGLMIEPLYNKVKDFAMEFVSLSDRVIYQGLSLFQTTNGAYTGNLLQSEKEKLELLSQFICEEEITYLSNKLEELLFKHIGGSYVGPLGVDMMIIANKKNYLPNEPTFFLHPMVEINLRHTMGHVALSLSKHKEILGRIMQIAYDGSHYHFHLIKG